MLGGESLAVLLILETVADVFVAKGRAPYTSATYTELGERALGMQSLNVTLLNGEDNLKGFDKTFEKTSVGEDVHMASTEITEELRTGRASIKFQINAASKSVMCRLFRLW